ncbi:DODA-type extradiol aromatic ring-opening family dioxygenase [Novosphingobium aquimarinum]|uniref:DODA-type extradiol aromatic ring-opening family dioxygenase n=1 Tax=Novosphingobium aquimarinum TaxID=2682494 RepID=UPI0012EC1D8C|nr:class III extradiol ring-cleavage dioxygenase [Novosphingobium aquimarinum]
MVTDTAMPTFFIPHGGGPCFFMDWSLMGGPADTWDKTEHWLRGLVETLPARPKGIVVISGHWEEDAYTASTAEQPEMIFDYYGFPQHTYELSFPAPGAPKLAERIVSLLQGAGLPARTDPSRGFDHGVFVPFLLITPDADIPVVPLSMRNTMDPAEHIAAGRALAPLREEGILIVGSGMSFHNMRSFRSPAAREPSAIFDEWLTRAAEAPAAERDAMLGQWSSAPAARMAHPREEHLMPMMIAAGAGAQSAGARVFTDNVMMADVSAYRFG